MPNKDNITQNTDDTLQKTERFEQLFENNFNKSKSAICIVSHDGKFINVNKEYAKLFGYGTDDLIGKHFSIIAAHDSKKILLENHNKIFNGADFLKTEEKVMHKNGTYFYIESTNQRVNNEEGEKIRISSVKNISDRLKNELIQSVLLEISKLSSKSIATEDLFTFIHNAISHLMPAKNFAVCLEDESKKKIDFPYIYNEFNDDEKNSLEKEFEFLKKEKNSILLDKNKIEELLNNKFVPNYKQIPHSFVGVPLKLKEKMIGAIIIKDFNGTRYTNENKEVLELVAAHINSVLERKKYEEELIKARKEAEESAKLKSEFLAQISHEIRTPLNSILSFSSLIKSELKDVISDELAETFSFIERGGNRLTRTIELILNISKIKNQQYKIDLTEIDIYDDVLYPLLNELKGKAEDKGLTLELLPTEKQMKLVLDHYSISQLFMNLIDNAIKYTKKGSVTIKPFVNEFGKIQVDVIDTGIGIAEEYMPTMFEAFSQEEQGYTRSYEGIGLGLSLVKSYADLNNAEIKVQSEKNKGSVFSVIFN
jgi:PAS domain S-box-containing protein